MASGSPRCGRRPGSPPSKATGLTRVPHRSGHVRSKVVRQQELRWPRRRRPPRRPTPWEPNRRSPSSSLRATTVVIDRADSGTASSTQPCRPIIPAGQPPITMPPRVAAFRAGRSEIPQGGKTESDLHIRSQPHRNAVPPAQIQLSGLPATQRDDRSQQSVLGIMGCGYGTRGDDATVLPTRHEGDERTGMLSAHDM
jgi:hypothetical protein